MTVACKLRMLFTVTPVIITSDAAKRFAAACLTLRFWLNTWVPSVTFLATICIKLFARVSFAVKLATPEVSANKPLEGVNCKLDDAIDVNCILLVAFVVTFPY